MNKKDLINAVAARLDDTKAATDAVNAVLDTIQTAVASGDKVTILGFGAFDMVHKPARTARNPQNGDPIKIEESWAPRFRPGSEFKEQVNAGGQKAATRTAKAA